jgi:hypothetical protein
VAGCGTPNGFAGHAGATANAELTSHWAHRWGLFATGLGGFKFVWLAKEAAAGATPAALPALLEEKVTTARNFVYTFHSVKSFMISRYLKAAKVLVA